MYVTPLSLVPIRLSYLFPVVCPHNDTNASQYFPFKTIPFLRFLIAFP